MEMKNVLFISYEFPPINKGGTQRPLKFVKYLRDFNINPIVLTLHPESYPLVYDNYRLDEATFHEINKVAEIHQIKSENILKLYQGKVNGFFSIYFSLVQKEARGWEPYLLPKVESLVKENKIKAIFATVPPFSIAPLACALAQKHRLPLVLDFRDAWSQWVMNPFGSYLHYKLLLQLEERCLKVASAIVGTSDQTLSDFIKVHPKIEKEKFHLIPNGFDADISSWELKKSNSDNKFLIGYVGSFYYNPEARKKMFTPWWKKKGHHIFEYTPKKEDWLYRSPYFFFKALARLKEVDLLAFNKVEVVFAGVVPDWLPGMVEEFKLQEKVKFLGWLNHQESLKFQKSCDGLLLTSSKVIGGEDYSIAGKTFEYITMGKPIIAFVAEGAQKRFLEETGISVICNPDDEDDSSTVLADLINNKILPEPNSQFLNSLHRKELTKKLANLFHKI